MRNLLYLVFCTCALGACAEPASDLDEEDEDLGGVAPGATLGAMSCAYDEIVGGDFCVTWVRPSMTDHLKCTNPDAIGCEKRWRRRCEANDDCMSNNCDMQNHVCKGDLGPDDTYAPNAAHFLGVPTSPANPEGIPGKLLVFLNGKGGTPAKAYIGLTPEGDKLESGILQVAGGQGYHVIGLTYFNGGGAGSVQDGSFMREVVTGDECDAKVHAACKGLPYTADGQDTLENRLVMLLKWGKRNQPGWGWEDYLDAGKPKWSNITLVGYSMGSSYSAFIGQNFPVGRIALLNGPNDGRYRRDGHWVAATYLATVSPTVIDDPTRFYGLVSTENHAIKGDRDQGFFQVKQAWTALGMTDSIRFNPEPDGVYDFTGKHRLYSAEETLAYDVLARPSSTGVTDPLDDDAGHHSVFADVYDYMNDAGVGVSNNATTREQQLASDCHLIRNLYGPNPGPIAHVPPFVNDRCMIGYRPAWRYIIGSGALGTP